MLKQDSTKYRGYRNAGIRMTEELLPNLSHGIEGLDRTVKGLHAFDKAHLVMLVEESLISMKHGQTMLKTLRKMEELGTAKTRSEVGGGIHSGEQYLIRQLGEEIGGRIHLGRSSGDLCEVSRRIAYRDDLLKVLRSLNDLRRVLIKIGEEQIETVMPGFTHGQHAQPTTFGHYMLSYAAVLERDCDRLLMVYRKNNDSPAGAVILTGTNFPINRFRTAKLLGFNSPVKNSIDAVQSFDILLEIHCSMSILQSSLMRISEDLMLWFSNDFNLIDFPDGYCGTSSIMMHKKNPYAPQEIKGAATAAIGGLVTAFLTEKDPTGVPNIDRASSRNALYRSFDTAIGGLNWLIDLFPQIQPKKDIMKTKAGEHWAQATELATALVIEHDIPWRSAHQIIGILVRLALEREIPPMDITSLIIEEASELYFGKPLGLSQTTLTEALNPSSILSNRNVYGGPGIKEVRLRLSEYLKKHTEDVNAVKTLCHNIKNADRNLENSIDEVLKISK
jgi:argininosuccinate lyase